MLLLKPRWRKSARKSSRADVDRLVVLVGAGRRKAGMRRRRICRSTRTDPTERGWKPRRATAPRTSQVKWNGVLVDFDVCCCKSSIRLTGCLQTLYSSQSPGAWDACTEGSGNGDVVLGCEDADSVGSNAQYAGVSPKLYNDPSGCSRKPGESRTTTLVTGLVTIDRAIGRLRRCQMVRQDLSDPEVRWCRCCVTLGCTGNAMAAVLQFLCMNRFRVPEVDCPAFGAGTAVECDKE